MEMRFGANLIATLLGTLLGDRCRPRGTGDGTRRDMIPSKKLMNPSKTTDPSKSTPLDTLGRFGTLWDALGRHGTLYDALRRPGTLWDALGRSGTLWGYRKIRKTVRIPKTMKICKKIKKPEKHGNRATDKVTDKVAIRSKSSDR